MHVAPRILVRNIRARNGWPFLAWFLTVVCATRTARRDGVGSGVPRPPGHSGGFRGCRDTGLRSAADGVIKSLPLGARPQTPASPKLAPAPPPAGAQRGLRVAPRVDHEHRLAERRGVRCVAEVTPPVRPTVSQADADAAGVDGDAEVAAVPLPRGDPCAPAPGGRLRSDGLPPEEGAHCRRLLRPPHRVARKRLGQRLRQRQRLRRARLGVAGSAQ